MAHVAGTEAAEVALVTAFYDEHAMVLWRYAMRLTGDASCAEDVVQETLLRAWQHTEIISDSERSPRAWLFAVARNMIIDERRNPRSRNVVNSLDDSSTPEQSAPDEVNATLDRMLIADAMTQLSFEHRAVIERSYYQGWTTAQTAGDLGNRRRNREVPITLCCAGTPTHTARDGGDPMTTLRHIWTPIGPESQLVPGDWRYTKGTPRLIHAVVCRVYLMMHSEEGMSS